MCNEDETLNGQPILYDEVGDATKYYLLENEDDPSRVTLKVYGINELDEKYGGIAICIPTEILERMAHQLRSSVSPSGHNTDALRTHTDDEVRQFLCENMSSMLSLINDPVALPVLIANTVNVIDDEVDLAGDPEEGDPEEGDPGEGDPANIEIDTDCPEYILIRYCIRFAYEAIRTANLLDSQ